jgi:predicted dehydrogenase
MTAQTPLRVAVIGCGAIAYEHLPFLSGSPLVRLTAVCDHSAAMASAAAERFGADRVFIDVADLLAAAQPDVVHVLTPPHTHGAVVKAALEAGAHVICEKPLAGSERETESLLDAADAANRVLQESRNLLFNDPVLALQRLKVAGRLGRIVECEILLSLNFILGPFGDTNLSGPAVKLPGGAVHDFVPHLAYLFCALAGVDEVQQLRGTLQNRSGNARVGFDFLDALLSAGEVRGRLRIATDTAPDAFRVIVRGTAASAETDLYNPFLRIEGAPHQGKLAPFGQVTAGLALFRAGISGMRNKVMGHGTMHGLPRMLDAIYTALIQGAPPPFSRKEMLATARLTDRLIALKEHP